MKALNNKSIQKIVSEKIATILEAGVNPWHRPWKKGIGPNGAMPHNAASGHIYRGVNVPWLMANQIDSEFESNAWLSFKQAKALGGTVSKGSKSTPVIFTKVIRVKDDTGASPDGKKNLWLLKTYPLFNVSQCRDLTLPKRETEEFVEREPSEIEDSVMELYERHSTDVRMGGDQAYYSHGRDYIQLPYKEAFDTVHGFAGTALHELIHWTGHKSRCARPGITDFEGFGSPGYAREELVAEFGATMLCYRLDINGELENHASYLNHWAKVVRDDNQAIFRAARLSERACDFLLPEFAAVYEEAA